MPLMHFCVNADDRSAFTVAPLSGFQLALNALQLFINWLWSGYLHKSVHFITDIVILMMSSNTFLSAPDLECTLKPQRLFIINLARDRGGLSFES